MIKMIKRTRIKMIKMTKKIKRIKKTKRTRRKKMIRKNQNLNQKNQSLSQLLENIFLLNDQRITKNQLQCLIKRSKVNEINTELSRNLKRKMRQLVKLNLSNILKFSSNKDLTPISEMATSQLDL
jgi:hypothetical protein